MSGVTTVVVEAGEAGLRLDRWFRRHYPGLGHGRLEKLLRTGQVRVDGRRAKAGQRLEADQKVRVPPLPPLAKPAREAPPPSIDRTEAKALQERVLYRDEAVIVLDKPAGLAVQGGSGTRKHLDAMLDALRFGGAERPRLVHRLDKDTSGTLVLARDAAAAAFLAKAFRGRAVTKLYWAAVVGVPRPREGEIDAPLAKLPGRRGERVVADRAMGRRARTAYRVVAAAGRKAAWLAMEPRTGRTHQLRVHCALLGTPIVGDGKYGGKEAFTLGDAVPKRLHLHARAVRLPLPSGRDLTVTAPLPEHMRTTWAFLGFDETLAGGDEPGMDADAFLSVAR
jgi:23S rRNA pseudouridine955/2504/2580 synthase